MKSLGVDIGSTSVKVSLLDIASGECAASSANPATEMPIGSPQSGWAEQDPEMWWHYVCEGIRTIAAQGFAMSDVVSVGITYQMHGLVCLDRQGRPLRPSIIWCDSPRRGDRGRSAGRHRTGVLSRAHPQLTGQLHCVETGVGKAQRTRRIRADTQVHASGRLHRLPPFGTACPPPSAVSRSRYSGTSKRSGGPTSWPGGTAFRRR